jgi:hypothetical protein
MRVRKPQLLHHPVLTALTVLTTPATNSPKRLHPVLTVLTALTAPAGRRQKGQHAVLTVLTALTAISSAPRPTHRTRAANRGNFSTRDFFSSSQVSCNCGVMTKNGKLFDLFLTPPFFGS